MKPWSNIASVVYKRTYSRKDTGKLETWENTVDRYIEGNVKIASDSGHTVSQEEINELKSLGMKRKATPAGRGIWASNSLNHKRIGGVALNNCWFLALDELNKFVIAQDLLMLGGGVGGSIEHKYVSKLPKVKKNIPTIICKNTKDADFIVPDNREGWNELTYKVLESFFITGKSFSYSTICLRPYGEDIVGFGGKASGPAPLIKMVEKLSGILIARQGKHLRPIDAMDILCCIGEMVVAGNVRRSAIIIIGDSWDKEYLVSKRWDLGAIPTERAMANLSVNIEDIEDLHPLFWETYKQGEPFGIINLKNINKYGRMGEVKKDTAQGVNPCVSGDTEILTDDGYKPIESLVGQKVNVWNGFEWSEVEPKVTGKNQPMLKVTLSDGRVLKCTEYHNFHISVDYHGKTEKIKAKDLESGMKLIKHSFPIIEHGLELKDAYTQGFVAAEGMELNRNLSVYKPKEMCLSRLENVKSCKWSEQNQRHQVILNITPVSKNFVPLDYNLKSKIEWLSGLFDGDGTELKEGGLQLASVNREFLKNTQTLLSTLGVQSKVIIANKAGMRMMPDGKGSSKEYMCQESYRICIGAVQMQELKKLGLKCERMSFNKTPQRDATQFITVVDVTEAGIEDTVYCFTEPKRNLGIFNGVITGQCAEATLEDGEPCNLQELFLPNLENEQEFIRAAKLMHRYGKRVTLEKYHHEKTQKVIEKNRRIGTGITGCLQSTLFTPEVLNKVYSEIQKENISYSKELGINESIRTTVIKPSGTLSLMGDCTPGIHPGYSRFYIRRVRFSANDNLIPMLRKAGHHMEPVRRFDGTLDHSTLVVDFYMKTPENTPVSDEGFDTWKQLDVLKMAQKHWADQSVSVTVYYKKEEINQIKEWLKENLKYIKTISFLCHSDHGFDQAPLEAITEETYNSKIQTILPIDVDNIQEGDIVEEECSGGACPIR